MLRDAATVVVLRDADPFEVLLLRRHRHSGFAPGAWVFPGGAVDVDDTRLDPAYWRGIDPQALADRFAEPADVVLGLHVAAVRETFEESGLLLAIQADGRRLDPVGARLHAARGVLAAGVTPGAFGAWLACEQLVLDFTALTYYARWVTPPLAPKRYDTAFFLARLPAGQEPDHDTVEVTAQRWLSPSEALVRHADGELAMMYPTVRTLEDLAEHDDIDALLAAARAQDQVRVTQPWGT